MLGKNPERVHLHVLWEHPYIVPHPPALNRWTDTAKRTTVLADRGSIATQWCRALDGLRPPVTALALFMGANSCTQAQLVFSGRPDAPQEQKQFLFSARPGLHSDTLLLLSGTSLSCSYTKLH